MKYLKLSDIFSVIYILRIESHRATVPGMTVQLQLIKLHLHLQLQQLKTLDASVEARGAPLCSPRPPASSQKQVLGEVDDGWQSDSLSDMATRPSSLRTSPSLAPSTAAILGSESFDEVKTLQFDVQDPHGNLIQERITSKFFLFDGLNADTVVSEVPEQFGQHLRRQTLPTATSESETSLVAVMAECGLRCERSPVHQHSGSQDGCLVVVRMQMLKGRECQDGRGQKQESLI